MIHYHAGTIYQEVDCRKIYVGESTACQQNVDVDKTTLSIMKVNCKECLHELHLKMANAFQEVHERLREKKT